MPDGVVIPGRNQMKLSSLQWILVWAAQFLSEHDLPWKMAALSKLTPPPPESPYPVTGQPRNMTPRSLASSPAIPKGSLSSRAPQRIS